MPPLPSPSDFSPPVILPLLPACISYAFFLGVLPWKGILTFFISRTGVAILAVLAGIVVIFLLRRGASTNRSTHVNTACARCGGPVTDRGYRRKIGPAYDTVCHHCAYQLESE